jgi:hypothetical protein
VSEDVELDLDLPDNARSEIRVGDAVRVQTIWGEERGTVRDFTRQAGFPMVEVDMENGDTISVNVARCAKEA